MKSFGMLLALAGIVALISGVYGFVELNNAGVRGDQFDAAIGFASQFGAASALSASQLIRLWVIQNRTLLAFAGAIVAILGFVLCILGFFMRRSNATRILGGSANQNHERV